MNGMKQAQDTAPRRQPGSRRDVLHDYAPVAGNADELLLPDGRPRAHWLPLLRALEAHEGATLRGIGRETRRLVDELGVTYHVYSDPAGVQRPWPLDALPQLLDPGEWASIEHGLSQRARLFEWILRDVFGPGELLRANLVPPEFLAAHAGFLPVLKGSLHAGLPVVSLYAADLARDRDGRFRVIGDRAQAPSGSGYALQNREILSRTWPATFAELGVRDLGPFFDGLHRGLRDLVPDVAEPRIVLLSPGPLNEAWFEHVLLARRLGLVLVQGQDLVFRDGRIWLSTLGQLERVDVILRRVDDAWCDPLSLDPDSRLGVAGLVEAVRHRNVVVTNALGTGLLESPAWPAFLPAIARFALGEDLLLPSVATWWCGDPDSLEHVMTQGHDLVVRSIDRIEGGRPLFPGEMPGPEREALYRQIRAQPTRFVGQERAGLSTMPCLDEQGGVEPRHGTVRVFASQFAGGVQVLPGGLTRVARRPGDRLVSNQEGGVSKDTWVLPPAAGAVAPDGQPGVAAPEPGVRLPASLPRRVADDLLWAGRYAERAEGLIRWFRLLLRRLQAIRTEGRAGDGVTDRMLRALTHLSCSYPGFVGPDSAEQGLLHPEAELLRLLTDSGAPGSVPAALAALQNTANALLDRLSADSVRVLSGLRDAAQPLAALRDPLAAGGVLDDVTVHLLALSGLAQESMLREDGWRFMDCGRRLERGLMLVNLLRATVVVPSAQREAALLNNMVLAFAESLSVYRAQPASRRDDAGLLDLLLLETGNPRALIYQLDRLLEHLERLPRLERQPRLPEHARHFEEARARLRLAAIEDWTAGPGTMRNELDGLLAAQQQALDAGYRALFAHYLAPAPTLPLVGRMDG
ncbi:circularly permuted type 2 ATP-grasp protein [Thioalkalivibrio sp.]|uniref:circularly permuted type 2 ATP-grasp protein n=1 Tax=Thioalkalivibrio sp. TaxID=2093813 RepID=UPI00356A8037